MNATRLAATILGLLVALGMVFAPAAMAQAQVDIWVDAGHGGGDIGTPGFDKIRVEKTIAFQVYAHTYAALTNLGYSVFPTRLSDYFVTLGDRAKMANGDLANVNGDRAVCQLFISLHMDARDDPSQRGTTTYTPKFKLSARKKNAMLASFFNAFIVHSKLIQNAAIAFLGCHKDIGVRFANYQVLRETKGASILVESCILTNQCQQNKIALNGNQALIGQGIAAGVSFAIAPGGATSPLPPDVALRSAAMTAWRGASSALHEAAPAQVLSLGEGFEAGTFPPSGWTTTTLGGALPYRWGRTTDTLYVHTGTGAALVGGESPGAIDEWLVSPATALGPSDRAVRFFWSANRTFASNANAECLVKPTTSGTWTRVWQLLDEPTGMEWEWKERSLSLLPWSGQAVQVAFRVLGTNGADVNIDDFAIGDFATTAAPANDACATALVLPSGSFSTSGTTSYSANDMDPAAPDSTACSYEPLSSGDVFYKFNAGAGDSLTARVKAGWTAVIYVVDSCDSSVANCVVAAGQYEPISPEDGVSFTHVFATPGQYCLVVDGRAGEGGPFELTTFLHGPTTGVDDGAPGGPVGVIRLITSPNPTRSGLRLEAILPTSATGIGHLTVFDVSGRIVFEKDILEAGGRATAAWDGVDREGRRLGPGIYRARLKFSVGEGTASVVVLE